MHPSPYFPASSREKSSGLGNPDQHYSVCGTLGKFVHFTKSQFLFLFFKNEYNSHNIIFPLNHTIQQFLSSSQSYAMITSI